MIALALHLLVLVLWTGAGIWVRRAPDQAPEWVRNLVQPAPPPAPKPADPAQDPAWQEVPLTFIEVDPALAVKDPPRDAKFYSAANAVSGQPIPSTKAQKEPEITGVQKTMPKTFDTARPSPTPPQVQPKEEPEVPATPETAVRQEKKEAQPAQPQGGIRDPGETQLAKVEPKAAAPQPQPERQAVQAQEAGAPRRKPIKRLAQAMEQKGIVRGEKMLQQGGASRFSISPSFDVKSTPFGEYDLRMIAAVQERWWALLEERHYALERTGKLVLKFRLHGDGSISQMTTAESTVGETLSFTCEAAVMGASPFGRWPSVLKAQALDPREITFTFHYY
ncbi:MAG: hypothetical protein ACKPGK_11500 [Verrucomicrobiota bacterium]